MLFLQNDLTNQYKRRTLRVLYGQTQAYPYDAQLSSSFDRAAGALSGAGAISGATSAILAGQVATKLVGDIVTLSNGTSNSERPFGLFANNVGGTTTDIPATEDRVGVWRGAGSTYLVLAPAFDDTGLATVAAAEVGTAATEVYLNANSKGQLEGAAGANVVNNAARLVKRHSANAVEIELLV